MAKNIRNMGVLDLEADLRAAALRLRAATAALMRLSRSCPCDNSADPAHTEGCECACHE
jgi:hypothetical protein